MITPATVVESPTGVVWREATRLGLTLDEYVRYVVHADWNKAHQNLDEVLVKGEVRINAACELQDAIEVYSRTPRQWIRKTWDQPRRSHAAPISFCPDCLRAGGGEVDLRWQLRFSCVCIRHERELLNACPCCGEAQRYRKGPGAGVHWLDCWRFCGSCGAEFEMAPYAPAWLRSVGWALHAAPDESNVMQSACFRFLSLLDSSPQTVAIFASRAELRAGADAPAWAACALFWAILGLGDSRPGRQLLERFALLGADPDGTVGAALAEVVLNP